jgi:hypothetical protein
MDAVHRALRQRANVTLHAMYASPDHEQIIFPLVWGCPIFITIFVEYTSWYHRTQWNSTNPRVFMLRARSCTAQVARAGRVSITGPLLFIQVRPYLGTHALYESILTAILLYQDSKLHMIRSRSS